jgi:hypothetical protein
MGTPMMLINTNAMVTLPMPIWNSMMYSTMGGVCPLTLAIQVLMTIFVPINPQIPIVPQQRLVVVIIGSGDG